MVKRKTITKKVRFEVFKRDDFTCQYCGSVPPAVILEIDHVTPVSKGGDNDMNNLITSCFGCNRGKTNIELERITPTLSDNLETLKIKEEQLKEYRKFVASIKRRRSRDINKVAGIYSEYFPDFQLATKFKRMSIGHFIDSLPLHEVESAMENACDRIGDSDNSIPYFCGICWNKIKGNSPR